MTFNSILKKAQLTVACILLACIPLPQFAGDSAKLGLGLLCGVFIAIMFLGLFIHFFQFLKASNWNVQTVLQEHKAQVSKIDLAVLVLYLAAFVATISSYFFKESLDGLEKYTLYFFLYLSFRALIKEKNDVYALLVASLIGLFWVSIEGFKQIIIGAPELATWEDPNIHMSEHLNRIYSTLLNPNLLSAYLIALWPLAAIGTGFYKIKSPQCFTIAPFNQRGSEHSAPTLSFTSVRAGDLLPILSLLFALSGIFLTFQTGSRGAWLALGAQVLALTIIIYYYTRSKIVLAIVGTGALGTVLVLLKKQAILNRLLSIFSSYDHSSNSFRLHVWQSCWQMFLENPFFGIGPGSKTFYMAYGVYMDAKYSALGAYSLILEVAVEMGLLGLGGLLFFIYAIVQAGQKFLKTQETGSTKEGKQDLFIVTAILISLLGLLISGFFDIVILRPQVQIIFWLLVALLRFYSLPINSDNHGKNN